MGLLSDVFLASDAEVATLIPGTGGPEGRFPTVSSKGIDPVKLATLEVIVTDYQGDILALVDRWDDEQHLIHAWDDEWVHLFPEPLSTALAHLSPGDLPPVVAAWASTEEWRLDGADSPTGHDALRDWLSTVCQFAQHGEQEGRALYIWWCL